jgi:hypothetical protein
MEPPLQLAGTPEDRDRCSFFVWMAIIGIAFANLNGFLFVSIRYLAAHGTSKLWMYVYGVFHS